jgi:hypothetical protein
VEKAHGRLEIRKVQTSTALNGYLDFPHVAQVFRIERSTQVIKSGKQRHEVVYGITSRPPERAGPAQVGAFARGHWGIENKLHWVRDMAYDEDRSQIRTGRGAQAMAGLRNFSISCLRLAGWDNIASALRLFASDWHHPLNLLGI